MRLAVVGLAFVLGSCASGVSPYPMPDGRKGYETQCSGNWSSWSACFEAAAKACGGKYEIVKQSEGTGIIAANGMAAPKAMRTLLFSCPA